jgi:hypothetical protein
MITWPCSSQMLSLSNESNGVRLGEFSTGDQNFDEILSADQCGHFSSGDVATWNKISMIWRHFTLINGAGTTTSKTTQCVVSEIIEKIRLLYARMYIYEANAHTCWPLSAVILVEDPRVEFELGHLWVAHY